MVTQVWIEEFGGLAGAASRIRTHGCVDLESLPIDVRSRLEALFVHGSKVAPEALRDGLRYRLTRETGQGSEMVEVGFEDVPDELRTEMRTEVLPAPVYPANDEG